MAFVPMWISLWVAVAYIYIWNDIICLSLFRDVFHAFVLWELGYVRRSSYVQELPRIFDCDWINKFCVLASTQFFSSAVLSSVNGRCDHFLCKAKFHFFSWTNCGTVTLIWLWWMFSSYIEPEAPVMEWNWWLQ